MKKGRLLAVLLAPLLLFSCAKKEEPFTHFDVGNGWLQATADSHGTIYFASPRNQLCQWTEDGVTVLEEKVWNPVYGDEKIYYFSGRNLQQYDPIEKQSETVYILPEEEYCYDMWYYDKNIYLSQSSEYIDTIRQIDIATGITTDFSTIIETSSQNNGNDRFYSFIIWNEETFGFSFADQQFYAINYTNGTKRAISDIGSVKGLINGKFFTSLRERGPVLYDPVTETYEEISNLSEISDDESYTVLAVADDTMYLRMDNSLYTYRNGKLEKALKFGKGIYEYRSYDLVGDTLLIACVGVQKDDEVKKEFIDLTSEEDLEGQQGNTTVTTCAVKPDGQVYILLKEKENITCGNSYG